VHVSVAEDENGVAFSVADTGPGIPAEFRGRIFEKFFRVPVAAGPSGAGLGLSVAKNIVEAHGGQMEFDCPPPGGVIFRFSLPLFQPAAVAVN
jgi:signal transduction histidine kinase